MAVGTIFTSRSAVNKSEAFANCTQLGDNALGQCLSNCARSQRHQSSAADNQAYYMGYMNNSSERI